MATTTNLQKTPFDYLMGGSGLFKESFEKSVAALTDLNTHSRKNLEAMIASMTAASKGAEALGARAMAFSKKSVESQVAAAKALATAKSIQEAVELHTNFTKTAFESMVAEMNEVTELASASVKDVMSPINERVTAIVEHIQTAK